MVKYKRIYLESLGLDRHDFIPCEVTGSEAVDIHHICTREDRIENLMAVTRKVHIKYGDKKRYMVKLLTRHRQYLDIHNVKYDEEWFEEKLNRYKHGA
ncbi:MAG TPA: hypothetical protein VK031_06680 [Tissierellaceae bacterium]|nr:hypothetical protein [Tissierellaceae bacterium]